MGLFGGSNDAALSCQISRLERKVDAIMAHLQIQLPDDGMDDIRDLAASGNKIAAIKEYRARTGVGLAEAKQAVDAVLRTGGQMIIRPRFSSSAFWDDVRAYGATATCLMGAMVGFLMSQPVHRDGAG